MKLKLPQLPATAPRKKKLRAAAARRATAPSSDFDDMSEPNMKLSRALLIVLVLHVVAVAGIIAFNAIKSRQGSISSTAAFSSAINARPKPQPSSSILPLPSRREEPKPAHPILSPPRNDKKARSSDPPLPEGAKYYTVAKGDNPVTIAKKFKVSYDELLAANHIDDPRKLKVGQKLIIPPKKGKKD